jgi:serine/threonine-protein kinase
LDSRTAIGHLSLGGALWRQGRAAAAEAAYRAAVGIEANFAEAHCNLGRAQVHQGRLAEGLASLRKGHQLGSRRTDWKHPSARWVQDAGRLVQLEPQLPALLEGRAGPPANDRERLTRAYLCLVKGHPAAAARLYAEAFAAHPELVQDVGTEPRWHALWAAALAGCGRGKDGKVLAEEDRRLWRTKTLAWLRAERESWGEKLKSDNPMQRISARANLGGWRSFRDLAPFREPAELQKLPEVERREWQAFWTSLEEMIRPRDLQGRKGPP